MSNFEKLVKLAKDSIENHIIQYNECRLIVNLPTETEDLIFELDGDWYYQMLCLAGYADSTAERKANNMDYAKLVNALDDWYKTEMYPKLYNRFQSEGREIVDYGKKYY